MPTRLAFALALLVMGAAGCHRSPAARLQPATPPALRDSTAHSAMDAPLRQRIATTPEAAVVDVLIGIGPPSPSEARRDLEAAGIEVRAVAGDVVVARGTPAALRRAAALPWVRRMELSHERPPSHEQPAP